MIATKGATNIVLTYEFGDFDGKGREKISIDALPIAEKKDTIGQAIATFFDEADEALSKARADEKGAKRVLEDAKDGKKDDSDFQKYLFDTFIPALRLIGLTTEKAATATKPAFDKLNSICTSCMGCALLLKRGANGADVVLSVNSKDQKLLTFITDPAQAYALTTDMEEDKGRPIYRKVGEVHTRDYVQDDDGVFTRRYAAMWKGEDVLELLRTDGVVRGRIYTKIPAPTGGKLATDSKIFEKQATEAHRVEPTVTGYNLRQMLHVHQELGSGEAGRGLCLTSTSVTEDQVSDGATWYAQANSKKTYANSGDPFDGSSEPGQNGAIKNGYILVDLSRVPQKLQLLYNLYRPDAQEKSENQPISILTKYKRKKQKFFKDNNHMLDSVSKNREIFLRALIDDFIVGYRTPAGLFRKSYLSTT